MSSVPNPAGRNNSGQPLSPTVPFERARAVARVQYDYTIPALTFWPAAAQVTFLPDTPGWAVARVDVGPDLAAEMIDTKPDNQRNFKNAHIERIKTDMTEGRWKLTHQGVAFNTLGRLHDGQNRLHAVVRSGATVPVFVWFGAGRDPEMTVIDTHCTRNVIDAAKVNRQDLDSRMASTLQYAIRYGVVNGQAIVAGMTHGRKLELFERYAGALRAVSEWFGHTKMAKRVGSGPVRAAVFCATAHVDVALLERFARVLSEQADPIPGEGIAKRLRGLIVGETNPVDRDIFLKTCRSILHFVNQEDPGKLYACPDNPFPIDLN